MARFVITKIHKIMGGLLAGLIAVWLLMPYLISTFSPSSEQLIQWARQKLPYPMEVAAIHLSWEALSPALIFSELTILTPDKQSQALSAKQLKMILKPWPLLLGHFQLNKVSIEGAQIELRYQDGQLAVEGLPELTWDLQNNTESMALNHEWSIKNSDIQVNWQEKSFPLTQVNVTLNPSTKIQAKAKVGGLKESIDLNVEGQLKTSKDIYLHTVIQSVDNKVLKVDLKGNACWEGQCWDLILAQPLPVAEGLAWVEILAPLGISQQTLFNNLQPQGFLNSAQMVIHTQKAQWQIQKAKAEFTDLAVQSIEHKLKAGSLSGSVHFNNKALKILATSQALQCEFPNYFETPLDFKDVEVALDWLLGSHDLKTQVKTDHFSGTGQIHFKPDQSLPYVDLALEVAETPVKNVLQFLPRRIMSKALVTWLDTALRGGKVLSTTLSLKGDLTHFPFDKKEGHFEVISHVKDVNLAYAEGWPALSALEAKLHFNRRALHIKEGRALLSEGEVSRVEALIPDLGASTPILNVDAHILSTLENGLAVIRKSPIKEKLATTLAPFHFKGPMHLSLGLDIPLSAKTVNLTQVRGLIELQEGLVQVPAWDIQIQKLKGVVSFTEDSIKADNLLGQFLDQPTQFQISSALLSQEPQLQITAVGNVGLSKLQKWLKVKPIDQFSGHTDYIAQLTLVPGTNEIKAEVTSSLRGVLIQAPKPLAKAVLDTRPFELKFNVGAHDLMRLSAKYGDGVNLTYSLLAKNKEWQPLGGHLHFGEKRNAKFREDKILLIDGEVEEMDVEKWQDFLSEVGLRDKETQSALPLEPLMDLQVGQFLLLGMDFPHTKVEAQYEPTHWDLYFNGPSLKGHVNVPLHQEEKAISINLQKLTVKEKVSSEPSPAKKETQIKMPLDIKVTQLNLGKKTFENVQARLEPSAQGYVFPRVLAKLKGSQIHLNGQWDYVGVPSQMKTQGKIHTQNIGDFLNAMGMKAAVQGATGSIDFNLHWQGGPEKIDFASLTGQAELSLRHGYITGVNPALNRVLNLLNIDNVHRRLSLDFKDITRKGFVFDDLTGKFQFGKGKMSSNNVVLKGPSAKITAFGQTDLTDHALRGEMVVMPNVTGSLPIAAAIAAGNPAVGAAVWVVDKMFGNKIQEINRFHYSLSGTWQTPLVQVLPDNVVVRR